MILDHYANPIEVGTNVAVRDGGDLKKGTVVKVRQVGGNVELIPERILFRTAEGRYEYSIQPGRIMNIRDLRSVTAI